MTTEPTTEPTGVPGMEWHHSLAAALVAFQRDLPVVPKNAVGVVPGNRQHKYADLGDLTPAVLPRLAEVGLSWSCSPMLDEQGRFVMRWQLTHAPTGEFRTGDVELPRGGTNWEIGSALTYLRRYCLECATGVVATADDDGRSAVHAYARPPTVVTSTPAASNVTPATLARGYLGQAAEDNGWDLAVIAALYQEEHGVELGDDTDAARIRAFRDGLFSRSDLDLRPRPEEASAS